MPATKPTCRHCDKTMEEGFLLDHGHLDKGMVEKWVEGPPSTAWWADVKRKGMKTLPVASWRCADCGYLESYAN